jgi:hypothetical protein
MVGGIFYQTVTPALQLNDERSNVKRPNVERPNVELSKKA